MLSNTPSGQPPGGLYLAAYFRSDADTQLYMAVSMDGIGWSPLGRVEHAFDNYLRDPAPLYLNGQWVVLYTGETPGDSSVPGNHFAVATGPTPLKVA